MDSRRILDLPFSEFTHHHELEKRRLQPDAVLEIPSLHERYFVELETGSATIWDQEKLTSTLTKLKRYSDFVRRYAGNVFHGDSSTFYSRAFPDHWPVELLFVTLAAHRRDSIEKAYEKWQLGRGGGGIVMRAMTLEEDARSCTVRFMALNRATRAPPLAKNNREPIQTQPFRLQAARRNV